MWRYELCQIIHVFSGETEHKAMQKKHLFVCTAGLLRTFFVDRSSDSGQELLWPALSWGAQRLPFLTPLGIPLEGW